MCVILIFPLIRIAADRTPKLLLATSVCLMFLSVNIPYKGAFLWFCIGACIVKLNIHITDLDCIPMWICSLFTAALAIFTLYKESWTLIELFKFIGTLYCARLSKCIYDSVRLRRMFLRLSEWTFIVYASHELTMSCLEKLCFKLLPTGPLWLLAEYILLPVAVIAGCSMAGAVFRKMLPRLYALATGSRNQGVYQ